MKGVPEAATRFAGLQTGELDVANQMPGDLLETIKKDQNLRLVPLKGAPVWLEPMSFDGPDSPLKDVRVRQALSMAIDRKGFSDAEFGGLGTLEGNWIPHDWPGAIERPTPPFDVAKAKQLLAEAGVAERLRDLPDHAAAAVHLVRRADLRGTCAASASPPRSTRWSAPPSTTA